jgi:hypothetical protein
MKKITLIIFTFLFSLLCLAGIRVSVYKTSKGNLYYTSGKYTLDISSLARDSLPYAPRDVESFSVVDVKRILIESVLSVYSTDIVNFCDYSGNLIGLVPVFKNGEGYLEALTMNVRSKSHLDDKLKQMFINEKLFDLMDLLRKNLKDFTIWSQDRTGKYSGFQFVLSKKEFDEYLKSCPDEKQP